MSVQQTAESEQLRHDESRSPFSRAGVRLRRLRSAGEGWWQRCQTALITKRPINEWCFTHMDKLLPVERVPPAQAPEPIPGTSAPLDVTYSVDGRELTLKDLHRRTYTTAFVVIHRGELRHETYPGMFAGPSVRNQMFSITKSMTSMLIGIALDDGILVDVSDEIVKYVPELRNSAYDGPTVDDLLNMTSGAGNLESWDDPESDVKRFVQTVMMGGSILDTIRSVRRAAPPGTRFNYSTIDTHVLGWVLEAASGRTLAEYAADRLWSRIGAEHDAYYWLSRGHPRTALAGGSFNATARDVARLGLLMSHEGMVGDRQVVPREWVKRSYGNDLPHLRVGALGASGLPHYGYSNLWWTLDGSQRAFTGIGIHGQYLYVDPKADVVILKCSAWKTEDDDDRDAETITALQAIAAHLDGR
jgi:CubicO group peptidase (beta-lactamase class C family)